MNRISEGFSVPKSALAIAARVPMAQSADVVAMLAICPSSADLLETNPALAVCVASGFARAEAKTGAWPVEWLRLKRRQLCRRLGFPGSESTVRVLAKIRPEAAAVRRLRPLRGALADPAVATLLRHLPSLDAEHLILACMISPPALVSQRLFVEMASDAVNGGTVDLCARLTDTVWLLDRVREKRPVFLSLQHLINTHERLAQQTGLSGPHAEDPKKVLFPPPPLPAADGIEPITSASELHAEGRQMENCVARYLSAILVGKRYFYRLLTPQRGTIGLRERDGRWEVFDCRARANGALSPEAVATIRIWLYRTPSST